MMGDLAGTTFRHGSTVHDHFTHFTTNNCTFHLSSTGNMLRRAVEGSRAFSHITSAIAGPSRQVPRPRLALPPRLQHRSLASSSPRQSDTPLPRDRQIPYRQVQLVQADSSLSAPTPLNALLRSYDPATHFLQLVSHSPPIVKVLDREEERLRQLKAEQRARARRKLAPEEKEVQVSWTAAEGDLRHKAELARQMLERGDRVQLAFAPRQGDTRRIGDEAKEAVVGVFEEVLQGVGARWRDDMKTKTAWVCYYGPDEKIRKAVRTEVEEREVKRKMDKDERKEARRKREEDKLKRAQSRETAPTAT